VHVVVMSWRDMGNPEAGGAERYLTTVAEGLVDSGHDVTVLTAAYPGAPSVESRPGLTIRRAGGKLTVYPAAALALALGRVRDVDIVVDVQNGVPFFSRVATGAPVVVLVHHVHQEQWSVVYGPRAARLGWWVESRLAPWLYSSCEYVTVSEHTRRDLVRLGIGPERITVVHNGTDAARGAPQPADTPRLVSLGRLVPHKQVEHTLRLVDRLRPQLPNLHLDVIGDGWWRDRLHALASGLRLDDAVTFHGHVSEERKHELLSTAWVHVIPSLKEGWGLAVVEAGAHGVPTVGYRAAGGLADSVVDGHTGALVEDEQGLEQAVLQLLTDHGLRESMGARARARAEQFTWDETVRQFEKVLTRVAADTRRRAAAP